MTLAALIDEIPVLAAIAPYTAEGVEIRDARELRVKESDRIAAVAKNLRAMGAEVEEREDGLKIPGGRSCTVRRWIRWATTASPWHLRWRLCGQKVRLWFVGRMRR